MARETSSLWRASQGFSVLYREVGKAFSSQLQQPNAALATKATGFQALHEALAVSASCSRSFSSSPAREYLPHSAHAAAPWGAAEQTLIQCNVEFTPFHLGGDRVQPYSSLVGESVHSHCEALTPRLREPPRTDPGASPPLGSSLSLASGHPESIFPRAASHLLAQGGPFRKQIRHYKGGNRGRGSSSPSDEPPFPPSDVTPLPPVLYHGAFSSTLRAVKLLSLSTCALSVTFGPVVTFMTAPAVSVIAKGAMASFMVLFSASTTGGLHWYSSPYVHKLEWQPGSDMVTVNTLSWIGTKVETKIKLADVRYPETNRPLVTFEAGGKYYYLDKDSFPDSKLLEKLTPEATDGSV